MSAETEELFRLANKPRSEWEHLIDEWVIGYANCQRDRQILKRRLLDGMCFEPLSEEFGLSCRQTKDVVAKAQDILFSHV